MLIDLNSMYKLNVFPRVTRRVKLGKSYGLTSRAHSKSVCIDCMTKAAETSSEFRKR